ncbi:oligosaccharide flippase family protein [Kaustia mangrovi]|uniref:Oligosaccharide flippase family protein n=1 Tax=Kaustia mangrovi TaxID=2593653 RepID=A0A7S8HCQ2_9HYPH|nr:oligosaccharide flippase family protein [Kaustia mangrovi]QPC43679.1 oligosaccharide flippase family protein [Kaustia mangrovi]
MTLDGLFRMVLPARLHERVSGSAIATRLAHGSAWSLFGSAGSRLLVLATMIAVARILGQAPFGAFGLVQSTLGVVGMMAGIGLGSTATRFVAQYARTDPQRAGQVIGLVLSVSSATVLAAAIALVASAGLIADAVLGRPDLQSALVCGAALMSAMAFRGIQNGVFSGLQKFDTIARLAILEGGLSLAAAIPMALMLGVEGALIGLAASAAAVWIVGRTALASTLKSRGIAIRYRGALADWRILTGYSLPSFLANAVATPVLWFAMTLASRSADGLAGVGTYYAAYQWHGPMIFVPVVLMSVSIPTLVQEWEAGRRARFRKVTFWICGLTLAIALPPATAGALLSPWIMSFYGPEFRDGWAVLVFLLAAAPLHALAKISSGALLGMNRAWWVLAINMAWGATVIAVTLWLLPAHGVLGLAIAFFSAYLVLSTLAFGLVLAGSRAEASAGLSPRLHDSNGTA